MHVRQGTLQNDEDENCLRVKMLSIVNILPHLCSCDMEGNDPDNCLHTSCISLPPLSQLEHLQGEGKVGLIPLLQPEPSCLTVKGKVFPDGDCLIPALCGRWRWGWRKQVPDGKQLPFPLLLPIQPWGLPSAQPHSSLNPLTTSPPSSPPVPFVSGL